MDPIGRGKITLDIWRTTGATRSKIEARQRRRLATMLSSVRRQSRFYKRHYADGPSDSVSYPN